jgi:hypothetical protein
MTDEVKKEALNGVDATADSTRIIDPHRRFMRSIPRPKHGSQALALADYTYAVPQPPEKVYYEYKVPAGEWGELGNDSVGDCEIARLMHIIMSATAHTGTMLAPTVEETMAVYSAISGYDPAQRQPDGSNPTDTGCNSEDVFDYWQNTGISISGQLHKIAAWVKIASTPEAIKQAIWLFGAASIDIAVYQSMMDQTDAGRAWDQPLGQVLGYHAVPYMGYGHAGLTCVTWGRLQQTGWPTCLQIMQAAYAVVTPEWINAGGEAQNGFNLAALREALGAMKS